MAMPLFNDQVIALIDEAMLMMTALAVRRATTDASEQDEAEYIALRATVAEVHELEAAANQQMEALREQLSTAVNRLKSLDRYAGTLLGDPKQALSATDLGQALGISDEAVHQLEANVSGQ